VCHLRVVTMILAGAGMLCLPGCSEPEPSLWSGYAQGDYLYLAAPLGGRLMTVSVTQGQMVQAQAALFALDDEPERDALAEASARLSAAQAQAANTGKGRRLPELALTQAQYQQAQAGLTLAQNDLARQQQLARQGFVAAARVTDAQTALQQAQARLAELAAALQVAGLPARADEQQAAQAGSAAARAALQQAAWRAQQKQQLAPTAATVADVFFQPGEWVPAGQPVLSLLPPANVLARFYVPQAALSSVPPGQVVQVRCDGCTNPITARVIRVATQAEFTPPVIYSNAQRAKMVFMVEARPDQPGRLQPGQPLDVALPQAPAVP
jgi:HlyD family secretion protein